MSETDRAAPGRDTGPGKRARRGRAADLPGPPEATGEARAAEAAPAGRQDEPAGSVPSVPPSGDGDAPAPTPSDAAPAPEAPAASPEAPAEPMADAPAGTRDAEHPGLSTASAPVAPAPASGGRRLALAALALAILLPGALYLYLAQSGVFDTSRLARVESAVAGLRSAPPPPKPEVSRADLDALAARLDRLDKAVTALGQRPAAEPAPAGGGPDVAAALRDAQETAAQAKSAAQGAAARIAPLEEKLAALEQRLTALEQARASAAKPQSNAPSLLVLSRAVTADLKSGEPYAGELDALARLGADEAAVEALRPFAQKGAPSPASLSAAFQAELSAARAKVEAERRPSGLWDRVTMFLGHLVSVRRVGGDEPGSPAATVEAALARGDIPAALDAWNGLPVFEKTATPASGQRIKALAGAEAAARRIGSDALEAIRQAGGAKSG
jgi:hypothetical protein